MGTWGPGNFQDDTSADYLGIFTQPLIAQIEATAKNPAAMEPDEFEGIAMICNLEILACLGEHLGNHDEGPSPTGVPVGLSLPELSAIERWRASYLSVWDAKVDGLEPKPEYRRRRRTVIERTFDRLAAVVKKETSR